MFDFTEDGLKDLNLKDHIRGVPDFPKPGILFYDIGTLLANGPAWAETVRRLSCVVETERPDALVCIESRGFLVGAPLAAGLGLGLVMIRKKGKLPGRTVSHHYDLEYGQDTVEIQEEALRPGMRVLVVDDLLATGGTAAAAIALARKMGADVAATAFIIELTFLHGRTKIDVPVHSLISYEA